MKNPCSVIRQAWLDYKAGRVLRKKSTSAENSTEKAAEDKVQSTATSTQWQDSTHQEQPRPEVRIIMNLPSGQQTIPKTIKSKNGWHISPDLAAEFPWRGEFFIDEESNWRGTWVLEVKDLGAMDWDLERVAKDDGRAAFIRKKTRQWPSTLKDRRHLKVDRTI